MAVSPVRTLLYFLGIVLVLVALGMFFFETGLDRWVPVSLLTAGALLIIGLAVMSFASSAPAERPLSDRRHEDDGDVTVVKR